MSFVEEFAFIIINCYYTGVILAVSKHDESSSMIFAREVDSKFNGEGQPFQLWNENDSVWQNEFVSAEKLAFGSIVTFRKYHGVNCVYYNKVDCKPQVPELSNL